MNKMIDRMVGLGKAGEQIAELVEAFTAELKVKVADPDSITLNKPGYNINLKGEGTSSFIYNVTGSSNFNYTIELKQEGAEELTVFVERLFDTLTIADDPEPEED